MFTLLRLDLSIGLPSAIQRGLSQVPRRRATVDATLELTHQRVDAVPLLLGFLSNLRLPETLVGQPIRPVEFSDDRLTLVLKRLGDPAAWEPLEADLWQAHCDVYALPVDRVRLDATTSCGYHTVTDDGLMQLGHSKDHRPDLAQFKLMAAVAEPTGLFLAGDVLPGNAADDPLYLPLYHRARAMLGQSGLLYSGDCKMAALQTRAEIAADRDFYLTRLPLTGAVPAQFSEWVEAALVGEQATKLIEIRREEEL